MRDHPNLLFIYTDQQAVSTLGAYGNELIETPNMDGIAEGGVIFDNAYVTQPLCTPSRASLLAGLYPHTAACTTNNIPLPLGIPCLPEIGDFRAYRTAHHGKWHLGDEIFPQHGFQEWRGTEDGYRRFWRNWRDGAAHSPYHDFLIRSGFEPDATFADGHPHFSRQFACRLPEEFSKPAYEGQEASQFIRQNADHPFVLYVNFLEPHQPYFGCRDTQYDLECVALPPNFDREPTEKQPLRTRLLNRGRSEVAIDGGPLRSEADWRRLISNYWGNVSLVDTHVGKILSTLDECCLRDDTIIVFTSDHGDMMGSHRMAGKCTMFEESVKVPLLLHIPGVAEGGRHIKDRVSQIDLLPTLLEAMGQPIPGHVQGFSWLPFLRREEELVEKSVFIEWGGPENGIVSGTRLRSSIPDCWREMATEDEIVAAIEDPVRTIISPEGWKYTWSPIGEDELYDLNADPYEAKNLAGEARRSGVIQALRKEIVSWQQRTGDTIDLG